MEYIQRRTSEEGINFPQIPENDSYFYGNIVETALKTMVEEKIKEQASAAPDISSVPPPPPEPGAAPDISSVPPPPPEPGVAPDISSVPPPPNIQGTKEDIKSNIIEVRTSEMQKAKATLARDIHEKTEERKEELQND